MLRCRMVTVQGHIFHGKRTCSTSISQHSIEMREGSHNWDNEFREVCGCFLNRLLESSESVNVFFIAYVYICMDSVNICFHRCWYEWNRWMFYLLFASMNGLFECFLNHWLKWMESVYVFSLSVDMNGICECVYSLFM